jgi:hypothetical protein
MNPPHANTDERLKKLKIPPQAGELPACDLEGNLPLLSITDVHLQHMISAFVNYWQQLFVYCTVVYTYMLPRPCVL